MRNCNSCKPRNSVAGALGCFDCSSEGSNYVPAYVEYQVWSNQKKRLELYRTTLNSNGNVMLTSRIK